MNLVPTPPSENDAFPTQHGWNGVNVLELPKGQRPKATDVSPWYGVYCGTRSICATSDGNAGALDFGQQ